MKLGFLTACMPERSLEDIAAFAAATGYETLELAAWPGAGDRPFVARHLAAEEELAFNQEDAETLWIGRRDRSSLVRRDPAALSEPAARIAFLPPGHPQGYQDCFNLFVEDVFATVRTGEAPDGLPVFEDGLRAAQLTEAVLESAANEQWVDVSALEVQA